MNIRIIIDKSLFQSMTVEAFTPLDRYFEVIIPPILIKEILGDLATTRRGDTAGLVANLADRFGANTVVCPPYVHLICHSLSGNDPPMDGRIIAAGMRPVRTGDGTFGYAVKPTPEDEAMQRWQRRSFSLEEAVWAYRWQRIRDFISTKLYVSKLAEAGITIPTPKSLQHLEEVVESILANPKAQGRLLNLVFREFKVPLDYQRDAILRWFKAKRPLLRDFAPYAAHCIKANLLLAIGNMNESVFGKQHEHDLRDLEYCYYLPFCEVFASDDKKHRKLVRLLMRPDQRFVGAELSRDLKRLAEEWYAMTREEKIAYQVKFGNRPAPHTDSVVLELCEHYRPEYVPGAGATLDSDSPLSRFLKSKADELKKAGPSEEADGEGSFIYQTSMVSRKKLRELYPHADL